MKKSSIAVAVALVLGTTCASAATMTSATFTMLSAGGSVVGAPDTTVTGSIGGGTWSVASSTPFFGVPWVAHSGTTFGPGTYTFDTVQGGVYTGVQVGAGQVGGHILFNWGATSDIDVIQVWDVTCAVTHCDYHSTDATTGAGTGANTPIVQPDGIRGTGMIDGAFIGFNANFDFVVPQTVSAVPVPAAAWLFGSGLLGLVGVARRKKSA